MTCKDESRLTLQSGDKGTSRLPKGARRTEWSQVVKPTVSTTVVSDAIGNSRVPKR